MAKRKDELYRAAAEAPESIRRPATGWAMLEPFRFAWEIGTLAATAPMLATVPRGDGHPVMVLPGFAATDCGTVVLRQYLSLLGYQVSRGILASISISTAMGNMGIMSRAG